MTNLLEIPKILRMSNRNLSILHEIPNHCITVILDQWAMRSVLNPQIDVDDTTKSRIVHSFHIKQKLDIILLSQRIDIQMLRVTMI